MNLRSLAASMIAFSSASIGFAGTHKPLNADVNLQTSILDGLACDSVGSYTCYAGAAASINPISSLDLGIRYDFFSKGPKIATDAKFVGLSLRYLPFAESGFVSWPFVAASASSGNFTQAVTESCDTYRRTGTASSHAFSIGYQFVFWFGFNVSASADYGEVKLSPTSSDRAARECNPTVPATVDAPSKLYLPRGTLEIGWAL